MSSNPYKPDSFEKPFYENSIKTAFPSVLKKKYPDKYSGKLIHLAGIVDSVYTNKHGMVTFLLENNTGITWKILVSSTRKYLFLKSATEFFL